MSAEVGSTIACGLLAAFILVIGARRGFFHFAVKPWVVPIRLGHLIGAFAIYFLASALFSNFAVSLLKI